MRQLFIFIIALFSLTAKASIKFGDYFYNRTLRIDYFHTGAYHEDSYSIDELRSEPFWGGSHVNLVDTMNYGTYLVKVFSMPGNTLIYSRGYCTLFAEWQTTAEAKTTRKSFSETVVIPYPKKEVRVEFYTRDDKGTFQKKFEYPVKVQSCFISPEKRMPYPVFDAYISGDPSTNVDIVILPEGYTELEMGSFIDDCKRFASELFSFLPYSENKDKFNIRAVLAPSPESGTDIPADSTWRRTLMNSNFYTFDSERYLMTTDNKHVRDLAANAPYDQIYILANSSKYGGGSIFNDYSVSVNSNAKAAKIFIHEFGHGFAGLGDEYYTPGSTSYNDFYPLDVEPWEPNLTTLVDFSKKWKDLLDKKTPVPTPDDPKLYGKPGVFEGGGYVTKGVYRPAHDCLMNTFKGDIFCPACERGILKMIDFYTKQEK
jgi:hypothetical protein